MKTRFELLCQEHPVFVRLKLPLEPLRLRQQLLVLGTPGLKLFPAAPTDEKDEVNCHQDRGDADGAFFVLS